MGLGGWSKNTSLGFNQGDKVFYNWKGYLL